MSEKYTYEMRVTEMAIIQKGEPIFSEDGFTIRIEDEGAGEFVEVRNNCTDSVHALRIDPKDWPELKLAISQFIEDCRE